MNPGWRPTRRCGRNDRYPRGAGNRPAVWLEPAALGIFGVIGATITLTTYLYGLDFYTFTFRSLSIADLSTARYRLRDQFILFSAIYCIGTVALVVVLPFFGLALSLALLAAGIAIFQHAALEALQGSIRVLSRQCRPVFACFFGCSLGSLVPDRLDDTEAG